MLSADHAFSLPCLFECVFVCVGGESVWGRLSQSLTAAVVGDNGAGCVLHSGAGGSLHGPRKLGSDRAAPNTGAG